MMRLGALRGWSDPKSHRLGALKLICRPVAGGTRHPPVGRRDPRGAWPRGPIAVLSTVLRGACRPCPISPEATAIGKHASPHRTSHRRGRHPSGPAPGRGPGPHRAAVWHPGVPGLDPRLGRPGHLGRTLRTGPAGRDQRHRPLRRGLARFARASGLEPSSQPARPQPATATRQAGPDRCPRRRPGDPGRGGRHRAQDPRGPSRDDPGPASGPPRRPQGQGSSRRAAVRRATAPPKSYAPRCLGARPRPW
jgi:hypothetical protein